MESADLVVIGAGVAGLTVARGAQDHGLAVRVLDKGRGIGGRLATRRADGGIRFDHGAQYIRPHDSGFAALLQGAVDAGAAASWDAVAGGALVGRPGMSGLARHLATGLDITSGRRAGHVARKNGVWDVTDTEGDLAARGRQLVMATPAPQIMMVLGPDHACSAALADVGFAPCWTVMVAFEDMPALPRTHRDPGPDAVLSWVAHDGSKPGRGGTATYVLHAATPWSRTHLEQDADWVQARLLEALADLSSAPLPGIVHAATHRWRFSTADRPLGQACISAPEAGLILCGDWCLGDRAEHAWLSGRAALDAVMAASQIAATPKG